MGLSKVFILGMLICVSCKPQVPAQTNSSSSYSSFLVGWGGGFTGLYEEYKFMNDGSVLQKNFQTEEYDSFGIILKESADQFFLDLELLKPGSINLNDPGNLTQYLEVKSKSGAHRITWGAGQHEPPSNVYEFFKKAQEAVRILKNPIR